MAVLKDAVEQTRLEDIRKLYEASFPKSEKKPFEMILEKRKEGFFDILAIEGENGEFLGLAIMLLSEEWALLDYLAIEPRCQGGGVGSETLGLLQERYGRDRIVVEIEDTRGCGGQSADAAADAIPENAGERIRRKAFYLRNGMVTMDFLVELFGVRMEILTFGKAVTFEAYHAIYGAVLPPDLAENIRLA